MPSYLWPENKNGALSVVGFLTSDTMNPEENNWKENKEKNKKDKEQRREISNLLVLTSKFENQNV